MFIYTFGKIMHIIIVNRPPTGAHLELKQHIQTAARLTVFYRTYNEYIITDLPDIRINEVRVLCEIISDHYPILSVSKRKEIIWSILKVKGVPTRIMLNF